MSITKIVAGTDFNALATAALRFAGGIAARAGAELIVVYADLFDAPAEFTKAQVQSLAGAIERSKLRTRDQLETYVAKQVPKGVRWKAVVAEGLPATAISAVAEAERADFITVGTHGRGGLQRLVMGSVAEAVIREARVPVLTVHSPEPPREVRRVLFPANGSEEAAGFASHVAGALGAELTRLQVSTDAEILRLADSGDYDLIVVGAEHKLVTRHSRIPVLTVTAPSTA